LIGLFTPTFIIGENLPHVFVKGDVRSIELVLIRQGVQLQAIFMSIGELKCSHAVIINTSELDRL
jgi:hypothetical protein